MMDDIELKSIVSAEINNAIGFDDSEITQEQEENLRFYRGEKYGNEVEGRSQIVTREVMDVVEWVMPSLMEMFHGTEKAVEFIPRGPEDVAAAEQATDYVNYVYHNDSNGWHVTYQWIKDGLISKLGVVKAYWCEKVKVSEDRFKGLTLEELALVLGDGDAEIVEQEEASAAVIDPMTGVEIQPATFNVRIKRKGKEAFLKVDAVPPEEFLISREAKCLEDARFMAHRRSMTRSDLVAMGFDRDLVESLPADEEDDDLIGNDDIRFEQESSAGTTAASLDPMMREVIVTECYVQVDYDGDGIAEIRKIMTAGTGSYTILSNEIVDDYPFAIWSPILMPHTVWGMALVDAVKDLQYIKSTIMRQMLDGLYLSTTPRVEVLEGMVNLDDALTNRPGGIVRSKQIGSIAPISTPWQGAQAFPMLQYLDDLRDGRTGAAPQLNGLDADALNNNAGAAANMATINAAQSRVKLIARTFAEVGFKRLFKIMLRTLTKYQDKERVVRLRGQWVPIDPRYWNGDMDLQVNVGLGTGDKTEKVMLHQQITALQTQAMAAGGLGGMVTPEQVYNNIIDGLKVAGIGAIDRYFLPPSPPDPNAPPPPDPEMMKVQGEMAIKQAEMQMKAEAERARAEMQFQIEQQKAQAQMEIERMQAEADMAVEREKAALQMRIVEREAELRMQEKVLEMQMRAAEAANKAASEGPEEDDDGEEASMMASLIAQMTAALTAPKRVVRGPDGKVIGVETAA